jgi:hypothetical protein
MEETPGAIPRSPADDQARQSSRTHTSVKLMPTTLTSGQHLRNVNPEIRNSSSCHFTVDSPFFFPS